MRAAMSPTRHDERSDGHGPGSRSPLVTRSVEDAATLDELLETSLPSFGAGYLRRVWTLLDEAIGKGVPMTLAVAGPVTASGQHHAWLCPLLDTGWFAYLSTTDAVCYHDGHRALDSADRHPFHEVPVFGDDSALRDERTIRITDVGFDEELLLDQDRFVRACLAEEEFQHRMTGTEFRHRLGLRFAAQERKNGAREGLLALCARKAIPVFVGAPADGSVYLNVVAGWVVGSLAGRRPRFELDLAAEVFESCAYHYWGLTASDTQALGTLILGGGVPKNFNLQPEPMLSQILGLEEVSGYLYDIQITTAPVTDGSLSSCPPSEAVTWGKVDPTHHRSTCESLSADYSMVMPILTKALLAKRARLARLADELGLDALCERHPEARGYLRQRSGYRLYERRDALTRALFERLAPERERLVGESRYPLAPISAAEAGDAGAKGHDD